MSNTASARLLLTLTLISFVPHSGFAAETTPQPSFLSKICDAFLVSLTVSKNGVRPEIISEVKNVRSLKRSERPQAFIDLARTFSDIKIKELLYITTMMSVQFKIAFGDQAVLAATLLPNSKMHEAVDQIIDEFYTARKMSLSVQEITQIAGATWSTDQGDTLLEDYAAIHSRTLSTKDIIKISLAAGSSGAIDRILIGYSTTKSAKISAADVKRLAQATMSTKANDYILKEFSVRSIGGNVDDVINVAQASGASATQDLILIDYVNKNAGKINVNDIIRIAQSTLSSKAQDSILLTYLSRQLTNMKSISAAEIVQIANSTASSKATDALLTQYSQARASILSTSDVIKISGSAASTSTSGSILLDFAQSQQSRLMVKDLRELSETSPSTSISNKIDEIIDKR